MSTEEWTKLHDVDRVDLEEDCDCSVKAVVLATGIDYNVVHAFYNKHGRVDGRGANIYIMLDVLNGFNFLAVKIENENESFINEIECFESYRSRTLRTIERELKVGTYLVATDGHISCLKDGILHDWARGRMFRIQYIYKIIDCNGE